jgi:hypothetical protein
MFWYKLFQNKGFYTILAALTGVGFTFVPMDLHDMINEGVPYYDWKVISCFVIFLFVTACYISLGGLVLKAIHKRKPETE